MPVSVFIFRAQHVGFKKKFLMYTGCLKIREFRIESVVGKDPVEKILLLRKIEAETEVYLAPRSKWQSK
jgi:hypothetical protein